MFEFVIRDDDPNYFTDPTELESAYAGLPDNVPVSYAVVPFHGCTRSPAIPEEHWSGDTEYPLADNENLVNYLRDGLVSGDLDVMLHGYNHIRYENGPEFVAGDELSSRLRRGREYLESLLDTDISVFVPPNNSFSRRGLDAVKDAEMATFYYPTPLDRPVTPSAIWATTRDLTFKYRHKSTGPVSFLRDADRFWRQRDRSVFMPVRPRPYTIRGAPEVTSVSLTVNNDDVHIARIKRQMDLADRYDGVFCLAVHYHAFRNNAFVERFYELIEYARENLNPKFVTATELFNRS